MTALELLEKRLVKLNEEKNNLILRICGLSDEILQEQAADEYSMLEQRIIQTEKEYADAQVNEKVVSMIRDHTHYYENMFKKEPDVITALEITNDIDLRSLIKQHRLRAPTTLADRRLLVILANTLKIKITIVDMESVVLDVVPNVDVTYMMHLRLYVNCISRWQDYTYTNPEIIPVVLL
jgi:hypothetical protein